MYSPLPTHKYWNQERAHSDVLWGPFFGKSGAPAQLSRFMQNL